MIVIMRVVFDLDGTLANMDHRMHLITSGKKSWPLFFAASVRDKPVPHIVRTFNRFNEADHAVSIWTARSSEWLGETIGWLDRHVDTFDMKRNALIMRECGDYRSDVEVKKEWIATHGAPDLVIDDRRKVCEMWWSMGIPCVQVADAQQNKKRGGARAF